MGKVVGQCQLSHFEFLITVVVRPTGIIRGTVWSKVEAIFLLPKLRVSLLTSHACCGLSQV